MLFILQHVFNSFEVVFIILCCEFEFNSLFFLKKSMCMIKILCLKKLIRKYEKATILVSNTNT